MSGVHPELRRDGCSFQQEWMRIALVLDCGSSFYLGLITASPLKSRRFIIAGNEAERARDARSRIVKVSESDA